MTATRNDGTRKAGEPREKFLDGTMPFRTGIKIESRGRRRRRRGRHGILPIGDAANLYADGRNHSMTLPFTRFTPFPGDDTDAHATVLRAG